VQAYINAGVPSTKLNLGMPLYGRAFINTAGLGQPYKGVGAGTWEAGVYDFKDLPLAGATEYWDTTAYATYSYDNATGMLVSYDTLDLALTKVDFIQQNKLGGAMWWEVSGDKNDTGSIISNVSPRLAKFPRGCVFSAIGDIINHRLTGNDRSSASYPAQTARAWNRRATGSTTQTPPSQM
jgi:chitinase